MGGKKVRLYGEHANVHQSHSQNDSGDLRVVAGGDGELGCLCGKAVNEVCLVCGEKIEHILHRIPPLCEGELTHPPPHTPSV